MGSTEPTPFDDCPSPGRSRRPQRSRTVRLLRAANQNCHDDADDNEDERQYQYEVLGLIHR